MPRQLRFKRITSTIAAVLLASTTVTALMSGPAQATPAECDATGVVGRFTAVLSGASFDFRGRRVELQNESLVDTYSRAEIKSGFKSGDKVWIDRSLNRMNPLTPKYIDKGAGGDQQVRNRGGGWKQCGPFTVFRTQSVKSWHYAVRACANVDGISDCGKWYIDQ